MPILAGTDGKEKMSKSYDNHIGIGLEPYEMYSKVMSVPDSVMKDYYTLLTELPADEVERLCDAGKTHPKSAKDRLAREIAACYHARDDVDKAALKWDEIFSKGKSVDEKPLAVDGAKTVLDLVVRTGIPRSRSDARRLIEQGGVELDGVRITDPKATPDFREGSILKIGKKNQFFRLVLGNLSQ
jgi:tyrosyl-tRNA synthetase